jgi:signal transduction histidine kinase
LLEEARGKLASQVEQAGFELVLTDSVDPQASVLVDRDAFVQVMINLVDNAIKFAGDAQQRKIDIDAKREGESIHIGVRDYGPGVEKGQMEKIFHLFYRGENELTRKSTGTGIGLALVKQLVQAMGGDVEVVNRQPGAEFRLSFPAVAL